MSKKELRDLVWLEMGKRPFWPIVGLAWWFAHPAFFLVAAFASTDAAFPFAATIIVAYLGLHLRIFVGMRRLRRALVHG
jgi:hypothetical protein